MSKNKKRYEYNQTTESITPPEEIQSHSETEVQEAPKITIVQSGIDNIEFTLTEELLTLLEVAKEFNGKDHLSACSYYGVNRRECDCGVRRLWNAAMAVSDKWKI